MSDKLMYIPNNDTQNNPFCSLDTQLDEPTNKNSINVPKVVMLTNTKNYYKTLGTSVINS